MSAGLAVFGLFSAVLIGIAFHDLPTTTLVLTIVCTAFIAPMLLAGAWVMAAVSGHAPYRGSELDSDDVLARPADAVPVDVMSRSN
jgi:hypothetical protein